MKHRYVCALVFSLLVSFTRYGMAADHPTQKLAFERDSTIWIANIDGSSPKKIANGQSPDLSADGTKLAYNTVQDVGQASHRGIIVVDLASGQGTAVKGIPSDNCMEPKWSPDGKQLLLSFYVDNESHIGVINADGSGFHYVQDPNVKNAGFWSTTWAADGKSVYTQDMENLYQLDLHGKVLKQWVIEKLLPHGDMSGDVCLDASPDGKQLLMDVNMDEEARKGWDGPPPSIWTMDLATEKVTRLTPPKFYAWSCHWLTYPDSIVYVSQKPDEDKSSIYRMSTTGQGKDKKLLIKNGSLPTASR